MMAVSAFFRPGGWELIVIGLVIAVVFGAKRLPDIGRAVGKAVRNFRRNVKEDETGPS